jgi:DNA-binding response OmpR family regulator
MAEHQGARAPQVLIAMGDHALRAVVADALRAAGYLIDAVAELDDVVATARRVCPALHLLDLEAHLPAGRRHVRAIRAAHPTLPLIVTGSPVGADWAGDLDPAELGADACLPSRSAAPRCSPSSVDTLRSWGVARPARWRKLPGG